MCKEAGANINDKSSKVGTSSAANMGVWDFDDSATNDGRLSKENGLVNYKNVSFSKVDYITPAPFPFVLRKSPRLAAGGTERARERSKPHNTVESPELDDIVEYFIHDSSISFFDPQIIER